MRTPDLTRVIETFVPLEFDDGATAGEAWRRFLDLMRKRVAPLVHALRANGTVGWYSYLIHDRTSGVPVDTDGLFLHLRLEVLNGRSLTELMAQLPSWCEKARQMAVPDPPRLDSIDVPALRAGSVEEGWRIMGESAEWALHLIEAHDPSRVVPPQNVVQFVHYLGNQLFRAALGIVMP